MRFRSWLVVVAVAGLLAGCGLLSSEDDDLPLDERSFWSTEVLEDGEARALVDGTRVVLTFREEELGVSAGCNQMGGGYDIEGDVLEVADMFMTEMGCDPERHAQDDFVASFLLSGPTVTLDGEVLELRTDAVVMRFLDATVANPNRPIVGTTWRVDGFDDGQAASSFAVTRDATITFVDESNVQGFDGCGDFAGPAEVGPTEDGMAEVQFGDIDWLAEPCEPLAYVESIRRVLAGSVELAVRGANLRIQHPSGLALTAIVVE